jgi:hypothetical protein
LVLQQQGGCCVKYGSLKSLFEHGDESSVITNFSVVSLLSMNAKAGNGAIETPILNLSAGNE